MKQQKKMYRGGVVIALLFSVFFMFSACSNSSSGSDSDVVPDDASTTEVLAENKELSDISITPPGVIIADASKFADCTNESKVVIEIVCTEWLWVSGSGENAVYSTLDGNQTWFDYCIDGGTESVKIEWDDKVGKEGGYKAVLTGDAIASLKANGLGIVGNNPNGKITVTLYKKVTETTPTGSGDDGKTPGTGDGEETNNNPASGEKYDFGTTIDYTATEEGVLLVKGSSFDSDITSITVKVTNVTYGGSDTWWFWVDTDGNDGDSSSKGAGTWAESDWSLAITDDAKIAYIKEHGLTLKSNVGMKAKATVTINDVATNDEEDDDDTVLVPTWVGLNGGFTSTTWAYTALNETTSGSKIWTVTINNVTQQWPNFEVKAGDGTNEYRYAASSDWYTISTEPVQLGESDSYKLQVKCWENNSGTTSVNLKFTVDFTGDKPTIKVEATPVTP